MPKKTMKKLLALFSVSLLCISSAHAWDENSPFSLSVTGNTTNAFIAMGFQAIDNTVVALIDNPSTAYKVAHFLPWIGWQAPITISNSVPEGHVKMGSPWRRTFANPFKHPGDFNIGLSFSYEHGETPFGFYLSAKYKTTEVIMKADAVMDSRAHYFEPGAGLHFVFGDGFIVEAGASYDMAFKYRGEWDADGTKAINSGFCGDIGIGAKFNGVTGLIKYQHPFYNYYNKDYSPDGSSLTPFAGMKRKVGYISGMIRIGF